MAQIAILTYWGVPNYGAWTQAYALNNVLNQTLGKEAKHIAYLEQSHFDNYYKNDYRALNCFHYAWDEIPHTRLLSREELEKERFDIVITGSDSIWSFEHFSIVPDLHLMGAALRARRLYACAPSCDMLTKDEITEEMLLALGRYDSITVRDDYSRELLKQFDELADKNIDVVLDPALLWDFEGDESVKKPVFNGYIAVYGAGWSDEFIRRAKLFANDKQLTLISIGFVNSWCDISIKRNELRPLEWLGLIKHSQYVFTSTFHGLMTGISFERQVVFDQIENVKNRSDTLIHSLQIEDALKDFDVEIDYDKCNARLDRLRQFSMERLRGMTE